MRFFIFKVAMSFLFVFLPETGFAKKKKKKKKEQVVAPACDVTVESNDAMKFNMKEIKFAKGCKKYTLTLKHVGQIPKSSMGHNIVISNKADMQNLIAESAKAGLKNGYLPKGNKAIIAATKLLGGGESDTITIQPATLEGKKDLVFFCSFPGHWSIMKGTVVVM